MVWKHLTRVVLFWPSVFIIRAGVVLVSFARTPIGRMTIRPVFRVFCRFILYARPIISLNEKSQSVLPTDEVSTMIRHQKIIAVIPCVCRIGRGPCIHPLHKPHESDICVTVGLSALLQIGSGLGKRIDIPEAQAIFERAADSGLVHHVVYSMGQMLEICSCCSETCAVVKAYMGGIPEAVRSSQSVAVRGSECNACPGMPDRVCEALCPYGKAPENPECFGCGLCARHCPQHAIHMAPRTEVPITIETGTGSSNPS
jgi:Pyruvate/2-oxoacid:ferredoxin oxidoreductase delta subunit